MRKKILALCFPTLAFLAIAAACAPSVPSSSLSSEVTPPPASSSSEVTPPPSSSSEPHETTYGLKLQTPDGYAVDYAKTVDFDATTTDSFSLLASKDGVEDFTLALSEPVISDTSVITDVREDSSVDKKMNVTFGATGTSSITYSLVDDPSQSVTITYTVTEHFLNQTIGRGSNIEENGVISMDGSAQHAALVKKAGTYWMFKGHLEINHYSGGESVGLASFLDGGDHGIWFGLRNASGNTYDLYIRDFISGGWGSAVYDAAPYLTSGQSAYTGVSFAGNDSATTIDFTLIRDGTAYYYDIGGYHGSYVSAFEGASYAGLYTQLKAMKTSNYSITYDADAIRTEIVSSYGVEAKIDAAKFLSPDRAEIARGESRTFNYLSAPNYVTEAVTLSVDEAYASYVTIDGTSLTINEDAPAGTLSLTLQSASGKVFETLSLPVVEQSSAKENEQLKVSGGAILNSDGSVTFPTSLIGEDGVGNEQAYDSTMTYGATLKDTVLGGDFSIEFDVSNYQVQSGVKYPKLLVSLGGNNGQFYVVYNREGTINRIETYTPGDVDRDQTKGSWVSSENFPSDFDTTATHHYKIESKDGYYNIYLDRSETPLSLHVDGSPRKSVVPLTNRYAQLPIRIGTKGVSATVSNIVTTSGSIDDMPPFFSLSDKSVYDETNQSVTTQLAALGWASRNNIVDGTAYSLKELSKLPAAFTLKYRVSFSEDTTDAKFIFQIGDHGFHVVRSTGWGDKIEHDCGAFAPNAGNILYTDNAIDVTLSRDANGTVTMSVPSQTEGELASFTVDDVSGDSAYFYAFNNTEADVAKSVTLSNLIISDDTLAE